MDNSPSGLSISPPKRSSSASFKSILGKCDDSRYDAELSFFNASGGCSARQLDRPYCPSRSAYSSTEQLYAAGQEVPISTPSSSCTRHGRTPSLGELHQQLENEQEAQVNRLLALIRQQQAQISALQSVVGSKAPLTSTSKDPEEIEIVASPSVHVTPSSTASRCCGRPPPLNVTVQTPVYGSASLPTSASSTNKPYPHIVSPYSTGMSRQSSRRGHRTSSASQTGVSGSLSPPLRSRGVASTITAMSNLDVSGTSTSATPSSLTSRERSDPSFCLAENQILARENQMLKSRIRELEHRLQDAIITSTSATETLENSEKVDDDYFGKSI